MLPGGENAGRTVIGTVIELQRAEPVLGARAGGIPEYVPVASQPLLYPSGDVDALVESMRAVAEDRKRYAPVPSDLDHDWDDHLVRITGAYEQVER